MEKKNCSMESKNLIATVKYGEGSLKVWGLIIASGVGKLVFIDGINYHMKYVNILKKNLPLSVEKWFWGQLLIYTR